MTIEIDTAFRHSDLTGRRMSVPFAELTEAHSFVAEGILAAVTLGVSLASRIGGSSVARYRQKRSAHVLSTLSGHQLRDIGLDGVVDARDDDSGEAQKLRIGLLSLR